MKAVEKIKGYYKEYEIEIKVAACITALSIGWLMVGYSMGGKACANKYAKGLERMCEVTPEFKEQYIDALHKATKVKLMES